MYIHGVLKEHSVTFKNIFFSFDGLFLKNAYCKMVLYHSCNTYYVLNKNSADLNFINKLHKR